MELARRLEARAAMLLLPAAGQLDVSCADRHVLGDDHPEPFRERLPVASRAFWTRETQRFDEGSGSETLPERRLLAECGARTLLAVPLLEGNRAIGVLVLAREHQMRDTRFEAALQSATATLTGVVLHEREKRLNALLLEVGLGAQRLLEASDPAAHDALLLATARRICRAGFAALGVAAGGTSPPVCQWRYSFNAGEPAGTLPQSGLPFRPPDGPHPRITNVLGTDLRHDGVWLATLFVANHEPPLEFSPEEQLALDRLASHAAISMDLVRRRLATHTPLPERARSEENYRFTFDNAPVGMAMVGLDGTIMRANAALCAILGYGAPEMLAGRVADFVRGDGDETSPEALPSLDEGRRSRRYLRRDAAIIHVVESVSLARDDLGRPMHYVLQVEDVTEARRAQAALQDSERQLKAIFENTSDAVLLVDDGQRTLDANPAACALLGLPDVATRRVLGSGLAGSLSLIGDWARFLARGEESGERVVAAGDGSTRHVEYKARANILPGLHLVILRDVTGRVRVEQERLRLLEQLEAERSWLRTVIERSPIGMSLFEDGRMRANTAAEALFGRTLVPEEGARQLAGLQITEQGVAIDYEALPSVRALQGETTLRREVVLRRPDGSEVPTLVSAIPIPGKMPGAVVFYEDITAFRLLERLRREWTSVVAHDLRQSLQGLNGLAQRIARENPGSVEQTIEMKASVRQLDRMLRDLTDASLLEARRMQIQPEPLDLAAHVASVVTRLKEGIATLRLEAGVPLPPISADAGRVEQVLTNLVTNAAKYGEPGGEVVVGLERLPSAVQLSVTNQGGGLDPADASRLFARFQRLGGSEQSGLGLGLYIAKGLVEAHGGRIGVLCSPGKSTTFFFTLPIG